MPWWWITSAILALALAGPGRAQDATSPDSLALTPAPADTLILALPAAADTSALPPVQPDSLALPVMVPVLPSLASPPAQPVASGGLQPLPKRTRYEAQHRGFFTPRSLWGAASIAGSVILYNKGKDYRDKADDLYRRYQAAADPTEIERLYQRTTNQDTKGQVCWALGAALAVNGVRLLVTRETEVISSASAQQPSLQMLLATRSLYLRVHRWL